MDVVSLPNLLWLNPCISAYVWLLKIRPATEVGTYAYVNPFIAVFLGMTLGKEEVSLIQFAELIIILLSVGLINRKSIKIDYD